MVSLLLLHLVDMKCQKVNGISSVLCPCVLSVDANQKQSKLSGLKKNRKGLCSFNYGLPTLEMSSLNQPKGAHSAHTG